MTSEQDAQACVSALFTDLYELTMMQGYWASGRSEQRACFELFFRSVPEGGGYCLAAGIEDVLAILPSLRFRDEEIAYLGSLGLFQPGFLDHLRTVRFTGEVRCLAEGTLVFPQEPILQVSASLLQAQWLETLLLNVVNFQTLIATKASRIVQAAQPATVVEFGLRRAQGPNGGLWASKAAYLAGCIGTSNVEAGYRFGIPVYGTHAHSWVQSFPDEQAAFRAYAETFPDQTILLVDTYDTLKQGLPAAIAEAKRLEASGHRVVGIRLDSGDLRQLADACRHELDAAGLDYVKILASGDIDEYAIAELKAAQAAIDIYGVGTRLATAYQEPALGGVYKLVAVESSDGWQPSMKVSSSTVKRTLPGRKQVWRRQAGDRYLADALALLDESVPVRMLEEEAGNGETVLNPAELRPLLELRVENGQLVRAGDTLEEIRARVAAELRRLPAEHQRLAGTEPYRVGLTDNLHACQQRLLKRRSPPPD